MKSITLFSSLVFLLTFGCEADSSKAPKGRSIVQNAPPSEVGSDSNPVEAGAAPPVQNAPSFTPKAQPGWVEGAPSNKMRIAQYTLPKVEGDEDDAQVIVFYFDGGGGSVDANFSRWIGQFEQPDGRSSQDVAKTEQKEFNGIRADLLNVSGSYVAETVPGSGVRQNKEGFLLKAAVLQSRPGPYFIRMIGPEKTMKHWEESFTNFLEQKTP